MLSGYLSSCGLSEKEITIYLKVFQYGPKTATQVSQITGIERTNCYKIIDKLTKEGLIQTGEKNGVKQFWIEKIDSIKDYLHGKKKSIEQLESGYDAMEFEFQKLRSKPDSVLPKIRLFEQLHGLQSLYESILSSCKLQGCSVIQLYSTETLESLGIQDYKTSSIAHQFYHDIAKNNITIQQWKGSGVSLIEQIVYSYNNNDIYELNHGSGSTQLWIIGNTLFIILFKDIPVGIKIESKELSYMLFALLQKL